MDEARKRGTQPGLVPPRVAGGAEKNGALIVVDAVQLESLPAEKKADFGTDQSRRAGDKDAFTHDLTWIIPEFDALGAMA
jgi:hypothetical protein